jgi:hypothetical protein
MSMVSEMCNRLGGGYAATFSAKTLVAVAFAHSRLEYAATVTSTLTPCACAVKRLVTR